MARYTGLTTNTPERLLLDSGVFLKGAFRTKAEIVTALADASKNLGATNGGGSFNAVPEIRQVAVDGGITNIKDLTIIDSWNVTMVANVKEMTVNNIRLALGATTATTTTTSDFTTIVGNNEFATADYSDITWVGKLKGHSNPVIIIIKNAISTNGLNLTVADKDEATIAITLTACYDLANLDTVPFEILYPKDDPVVTQ